MRIFIFGDTQIPNARQVQLSINKVKKLENFHNNNNISNDVILMPGDLTALGSNNHWFNYLFHNILGRTCLVDKMDTNPQLDKFIDLIYNKLVKMTKNIYLCHGNHDGYIHPIKPVYNFIKNKYGGIYYTKNITDDIVIINIGEVFSDDNEFFLKQSLEKFKNKKIIIQQHYNFKGHFSDWWSQEYKNKFFNIIKNYNILFVAEGHYHITRHYKHNNILFIAGSGYDLIYYDTKNDKIEYF